MKTIVVIILFLYTSNVYSCSMAKMTEPFVINNKLDTIKPTKPSFKVSELFRGRRNGTSCSGIASLQLIPQKPPLQEQGYIFEVIKGTFSTFHVRDKGPVKASRIHRLISEELKTVDKYGFIFNFFEGAPYKPHKPIDITLKITAVSKSGEKSNPQLLRIQHEGDIKSNQETHAKN